MSSKDKHDDTEYFRRAMADVTPLPESDRADLRPPRAPPRAFQQEIDDRAVMAELLDFTGEEPETGEELQWLKPGYSTRVTRRLRRGYYSIADTLDLHGMDVETARKVLLDFIGQAIQRENGCVRVIHGKGLRSRGQPRLKAMTNSVLYRHPSVIAYASCRPVDGGTGATLVLLKPPPNGR